MPLPRRPVAVVAALLIALSLALALALAGCARRPELCDLCRREIHAEVRTVVEFADGRRVSACCPRCALHVAQGGGTAARAIAVTDYAGSGMLPIESAWLVDGSDETPCLRHHAPVTAGEGAPMHTCYDRCMPSLIAFRDGATARAFVADHGGTLQPPGSAGPSGAATPPDTVAPPTPVAPTGAAAPPDAMAPSGGKTPSAPGARANPG